MREYVTSFLKTAFSKSGGSVECVCILLPVKSQFISIFASVNVCYVMHWEAFQYLFVPKTESKDVVHEGFFQIHSYTFAVN